MVNLTPNEPPYPAPQKPPKWENDPLDKMLEALKDHVQTAMLIELYTIPLYLTAFYSISKDPQTRAGKIRRIGLEEMLHLGLSGNILRSIGGTPRLYRYTPTYPSYLFYDRLELNLKPATEETIGVFVTVERPEFEMAPVLEAPHLLPQYRSIGEFYQQLIMGIKIVHARFEKAGRKLFLDSTFGQQFKGGQLSDGGDGSWWGAEMAIMKTLEDATTALNLIITQGEGSYAGANADPTRDSHYETFRKLIDPYDFETYNIVENIDPALCKNEKVYVALMTHSALYSYLLLSLEKMWQYGPEDFQKRVNLVMKNLRDLMADGLGPLSTFIVQQPLQSQPGKFAAPPFRKYEFNGLKSEFNELKDLIQETLNAYPDHAAVLKPIQACIDDLVDLNGLA